MKGSEKDKKRLKRIVLSSIVLLLFIEFTKYVSIVPPGKELNAFFLQSLKVIVVIKYIIMLGLISIIFGIFIASEFPKQSKRDQLIIKVILISIALFLITCVGLHFKAVIEVPRVEITTVVDKHKYYKSKAGYTYVLNLDNGLYAQVNYPEYNKIDVNEEVYVVYVEYRAIGVFASSEYSLPE